MKQLQGAPRAPSINDLIVFLGAHGAPYGVEMK